MAVASESYAPSVLVSTEGLPEKDWLEYRRRGIGGSDAAAILGISPFATARDLYYDKLKIVPFDDSESNWVAKKMGHLLEDLVAEIFHVKTGYRIYQIKKMFYHPVHTFMLADILPLRDLPRTVAICLESQYVHITAGHMPAQIVEQQADLHLQKALIRCGEHIGQRQAGIVHNSIEADRRCCTLGRCLMAEVVCQAALHLAPCNGGEAETAGLTLRGIVHDCLQVAKDHHIVILILRQLLLIEKSIDQIVMLLRK